MAISENRALERKRRYEVALKAKTFMQEFLAPRLAAAINEVRFCGNEQALLIARRERLNALAELEADFKAAIENGRPEVVNG